MGRAVAISGISAIGTRGVHLWFGVGGRAWKIPEGRRASAGPHSQGRSPANHGAGRGSAGSAALVMVLGAGG
jgi:hypothetical protein